jgi:hypothetical protein
MRVGKRRDCAVPTIYRQSHPERWARFFASLAMTVLVGRFGFEK